MIGLKKVNIALAVLLGLLVAACAYYMLGTDIKVDAAVAGTDGAYRCDLTLSNGSLFPFEYLEFIPITPQGAEITATEGAGETISALSQSAASFTINSPGEFTVEIGYYVLGRRKTVTVTAR